MADFLIDERVPCMLHCIQKTEILEGAMKRGIVWISALALLFCACETQVPVQTTDIAPETTAQTTTNAPETTVVTTEPPVLDEEDSFSLYERYEHAKYTASEYRNQDHSKAYWTVVTKGGTPQEFCYSSHMHAGIPSVDTLVVLADVNFDGLTDLCINQGHPGNSPTKVFSAYLANTDGTYTLCKNFDEISSPALDPEQRIILSTSRDGASIYWYTKYVIDGDTVKELGTLERCYDTETVRMDGTLYSIAQVSPDRDRFLSADGEWNLDNEKWWNLLGRAYEIPTYLEKDTPYYISQKEDPGMYGWRTKYTFTEDGGLLKQHINYIDVNYNGTNVNYRYNSDGLLVQEGNIVYTYDDAGLLASCTEYQENEPLYTKTYQAGEPLYFQFADGSWEKWDYNAAGQLTQYAYEDMGEVRYPKGTSSYEYNVHGNMVREVSVIYDGEKPHETVFENVYDANGNLLKWTRNGSQEQRIYTYYPSGALKSEKYICHYLALMTTYTEYTEDGQVKYDADMYEGDYEQANKYERVWSYQYLRGELSSITLYTYSFEQKEYVKAGYIFIFNSGGTEDGKRVRHFYYSCNSEGEDVLDCTVLLEYDHNGVLCAYQVLSGDLNDRQVDLQQKHRYTSMVHTMTYDAYGRPSVDNGVFYTYKDCTEEQYALYQKVIAQ